MKVLLVLTTLYFICGCGVKGDPVPPDTTSEINRPAVIKAAPETKSRSKKSGLFDSEENSDQDNED